MSTDKILNVLVEKELRNANKKHLDHFVDENHALGVMVEEVDEVLVEINNVVNSYEKFKVAVETDGCIIAPAEQIYNDSMFAIGELLQVAAVAKKAIKSAEQWKENEKGD